HNNSRQPPEEVAAAIDDNGYKQSDRGGGCKNELFPGSRPPKQAAGMHGSHQTVQAQDLVKEQRNEPEGDLDSDEWVHVEKDRDEDRGHAEDAQWSRQIEALAVAPGLTL